MTGNESSEANISDFVIDSELVTEQPVIDDENGTIAFKVNDATTNDLSSTYKCNFLGADNKQ